MHYFVWCIDLVQRCRYFTTAIHFAWSMTMVKFHSHRHRRHFRCYVELSRAVTAFAWIHNISKHSHIRLYRYTMENQFNSPSFCVAFHFVMPSSIGLLQNDFALIMDEIDKMRYPQTSSQTPIQSHTVLAIRKKKN